MKSYLFGFQTHQSLIVNFYQNFCAVGRNLNRCFHWRLALIIWRFGMPCDQNRAIALRGWLCLHWACWRMMSYSALIISANALP